MSNRASCLNWLLLNCTISCFIFPVAASAFCAGVLAGQNDLPAAKITIRHVDTNTIGTRQAAVLFAHFAGQEQGRTEAPEWAQGIFDMERPGSFSHFFAEMSFNQLRIDGEGIPQQYTARQEAAAYVADKPTQRGQFGVFSLEILMQADMDVDFSAFDNDGPDGIPNSGDDDGAVDLLFIVLPTMPANFLLGNATGVATIGLTAPFISNDNGANGEPIRILSHHSSILLGRNYGETVSTMAHEYGHHLGLPDLFNTAFLRSALPGTEKPSGPENDSAGIGNWGLMGWGTLGWNRNDGPNSFSAWSRLELGWAQVLEPEQVNTVLSLAPVALNGQVYRIPIGGGESFLLENRRRSASYYDRNIPAEGLLIWHIFASGNLVVDLECADGRWQDAGFPAGQLADPLNGGDNLDFWAHDSDYALAHNGNFGDATDVFDGVRFSAFTPQTNPRSTSYQGGSDTEVAVEDIHYENDRVVAQVRTAPARPRLEQLTVVNEFENGLVVGSPIYFSFRLVNQGGVELRDLETRIVTDDPWVEVLHEGPLGALAAGEALHTRNLEELRPRFLLSTELTEPHTAEVTLEIRSGEQLLLAESVLVRVLPFVRLSGQVTDPEGRPAAGVEIEAFGAGSSEITLTDEEGFYEFELPGGRYSISPTQRSFQRLVLDEDKVLDFSLPGTFQVRGVVKGDTRELWEGEMVFYPLEDGLPLVNSTALSFGYEVFLPPGRFHVAMGINDGNEGTKNLGPIDIRASQELNFNAPIGNFTQGKLVDSQGVPVTKRVIPVTKDDALIAAISPRQAVFAFRTGANGEVRLKAVPGIFEIAVFLEGQRWALGPLQIEAEQSFEIRLPPADALLSGQLLDAGGIAIPQGEVVLLSQPVDLATKLFHTKVETDAGGGYQIQQASGIYTLLYGRYVDAKKQLWNGAVETGFDLRDLMRRDLIVPDIEQSYPLSGQVEYAPGLPQTEVLLVFYDAAQGWITQATVPAGRPSYDLTLRQGNYQVWARLHSVVGGIEQVYDLGLLELSDNLSWDARLTSATTAVAEGVDAQPMSFQLAQNYPNPFNSATTIKYEIGQGQDVRLGIYNLAGQRVTKLVDAFQPAGSYQIAWKGFDEEGRALASGVYIYRLEAEGLSQTRKLLLLR